MTSFRQDHPYWNDNDRMVFMCMYAPQANFIEAEKDCS